MDQSSLTHALSDLPLNEILFLPKVGSTNDKAAQRAQRGVLPLSLVVADEQTRGRGRSGRSWHTPPGAAIAMSLLLPTQDLPQDDLGKITGLGALAVCEAIQKHQEAVQIKWPNDVLLEEKKVCGVLSEALWRGDSLEHVVIGIGINVAPSSVPPAEVLGFPATSLERGLGRTVPREEIIRDVLLSILGWLPRLHTSEFLIAWEGHLAYRGENVELASVHQQGERVWGRLIGLNRQGHICLRLPGGEVQSFAASEIHLRPRVDSRAN